MTGPALDAWAKVCPLPLVLFFDGIDALHGAALREWEAAHGKTVRPMIVPFNLR